MSSGQDGQDVFDVDEEEKAGPIDVNETTFVPKRKMKVTDLSECKVRKYKYHDKYERKTALIAQSGFSIMNETSIVFGNVSN